MQQETEVSQHEAAKSKQEKAHQVEKPVGDGLGKGLRAEYFDDSSVDVDEDDVGT